MHEYERITESAGPGALPSDHDRAGRHRKYRQPNIVLRWLAEDDGVFGVELDVTAIPTKGIHQVRQSLERRHPLGQNRFWISHRDFAQPEPSAKVRPGRTGPVGARWLPRIAPPKRSPNPRAAVSSQGRRD